jgi:hypothetical protein
MRFWARIYIAVCCDVIMRHVKLDQAAVALMVPQGGPCCVTSKIQVNLSLVCIERALIRRQTSIKYTLVYK